MPTITTKSSYDEITISNNSIIFARQNTQILTDGIVTGQLYSRFTFAPVNELKDIPSEIQNIANVIWTPEVILKYKNSVLTNPLN
jgi:hypothetical protein